MPDDQQPVTPTPPATGAAPPSGPSSGDQARDTQGRYEPKASEWRYPADYAVPHLRGKTAEEAGQLSQQLYNSVVQGTPAPASLQSPQPAYTPAPQTPPASTAAPVWDDMNPAESIQGYINQATQQFQPWMQTLAANQAQVARQQVLHDKRETFERYGPEIDMELARLPLEQRTVENISTLADLVKARHLSEIEAEIAARVRSELVASGDLRSDGAAGAPVPQGRGLDLDNAIQSPNYKRQLQAARVDEATLREYFTKGDGAMMRAYGANTVDEAIAKWVELANKDDVITEVTQNAFRDINPPEGR